MVADSVPSAVTVAIAVALATTFAAAPAIPVDPVRRKVVVVIVHSVHGICHARSASHGDRRQEAPSPGLRDDWEQHCKNKRDNYNHISDFGERDRSPVHV